MVLNLCRSTSGNIACGTYRCHNNYNCTGAFAVLQLLLFGGGEEGVGGGGGGVWVCGCGGAGGSNVACDCCQLHVACIFWKTN